MIDTERAVELYRALGGAVEMSGGSAANTMCGIASFGGRAAYIGKVSGDDLGAVFGHDLHAVGVAFRPGAPSADVPTGRSIIVVTPDAQRTMNTYLGISSLLCVSDLDEQAIADGEVLYMEGYLFDRDDAKAAFRRAADVAHEDGRRVSLTLSDSFCVDRHRADFRALVRDQVDLLFGNEDELCSLYEVGSLDEAIASVRRECPLVAVTAGAEGSYVVTPDGTVRRRRRARRPGARHDRRRRPLRRRVPARPDERRVVARLRPAGLDRRRRGDQPRRPEAPRRAAYAGGCEPGGVRDRQSTLQLATRWLAAEPDDDIRDELQALIDGDPAALAERFAGRLTFGTAGLRAAVGAGPLRMNRLVVRQAAAGLANYLKASDPRAAERGVVIGYDVRRKSDVFAHDTARVMAAAGLQAMLLPDPLPTPVLAWSITELDAAAGVMVTASHNPPADNGYKVYLGDGAQIVPPHDVAHRRRDRPRRCHRRWPSPTPDDALITTLDDGVMAAYLASIAGVRLRPDVPGHPGRLHADARRRRGDGVHGLRARRLRSPGRRRRAVRARRDVPDGVVPEPGGAGRDGSVARPRRRRPAPTLAIANDPDADRLGAAIPQPDGSWRRLGGDEIGWLLADHILANTTGDDRLVITTLVSSSLLGDMAKSYGVHAKETYTGFKWIARTILDNPDLRFVLGYEQALGYLVAPRPLDKDGISAALMLAEVAAVAAAEGTTLQQRLDDIAARFGRHVTIDKSVRMDPAAAAEGRRAAASRARRRRSAGPVSSTSWRSPRPICCASSSPAASACRSARAAPSRR